MKHPDGHHASFSTVLSNVDDASSHFNSIKALQVLGKDGVGISRTIIAYYVRVLNDEGYELDRCAFAESKVPFLTDLRFIINTARLRRDKSLQKSRFDVFMGDKEESDLLLSKIKDLLVGKGYFAMEANDVGDDGKETMRGMAFACLNSIIHNKTSTFDDESYKKFRRYYRRGLKAYSATHYEIISNPMLQGKGSVNYKCSTPILWDPVKNELDDTLFAFPDYYPFGDGSPFMLDDRNLMRKVKVPIIGTVSIPSTYKTTMAVGLMDPDRFQDATNLLTDYLLQALHEAPKIIVNVD